MARRSHRKRGRLTRNVRQPPGTMIANPESPKPRLTVIAYGPDSFEERVIERPEELAPLLSKWPVVWLNVEGLGDVEVIRRIGEILQMHPLALEDVVDTSQRPKMDPYPEGTFLVLRSAELTDALILEQMSVFVGKHVVATFQEIPGDCLDELRDRIRRGRGRVRRSSTAYLGYAIADLIIDSYFMVLDRYGDELEELEHQILAKPRPDLVARLFEVKRELLAIRRAIWPMRDVTSALMHDDATNDPEVRLYARDAHDHATRIIDLVESFRELTTSMVDVYLANVSNQMNQVVKVLTIISTIFIPLSFVASIYGMNFDHMPELHWRYGYAFAWGVIALIAAILLFNFWWRGWFSRGHGAVTDGIVVEPAPPRSASPLVPPRAAVASTAHSPIAQQIPSSTATQSAVHTSQHSAGAPPTSPRQR